MRYIQLLFAATYVLASPLDPGTQGAIDRFKPGDEVLPDDLLTKELMLKYKPTLQVVDSCLPQIAVDAQGNTPSGLEGYDEFWKGDLTNCQDPKLGSQVYARTANYRSKKAIMYTWYFAKVFGPGYNDDVKKLVRGSHRHDWQQLIIWLKPRMENASKAEDFDFESISYSTPNGYIKGGKLPDGSTHPYVTYQKDSDKLHGLVYPGSKGSEQKLIAWDKFTPQARAAINDWTNWFDGYAMKYLPGIPTAFKPPFSDKEFEKHLQAAS